MTEAVTQASGPTLETSLEPGPHRATKSRHPLAPLFSAGTVRLRCAAVLQSVEQNLSGSFRLDRPALGRLAERVVSHLQAAAPAAPKVTAPFWQHLQADGVDRLAELDHLLQHETPAEQARAWADLALLGVLLSADPGPRWRYAEHLALPAAAFAQATPDELLALLDQAGKTALPVPPSPDAAAPGTAETAAPTADAAASTTPELLPVSVPVFVPVSVPDPAPDPAPVSAPTSASMSAPVSVPTPALGAGGSAGLALATFRAFVAGAFSADKLHPCRADAATLRHVDVAAMRALLQGTPQNPNLGLDGRAALLSRWGQMLQSRPGAGGARARPSDLVPVLAAPARAGAEVQATRLLADLLLATAATWGTAPVQGLPAGDVWQHRWAGEAMATDATSDARPEPGSEQGTEQGSKLETDLGTGGWVPLHAAAQAMVAALALPLQQKAGCHVVGLDQLTASADHLASSLLLAAGVIVPRQQRLLARSLKLADEAVVECRALTVALFDELTRTVRTALQGQRGAVAAGLTVAEVVQATTAVLNPGAPLGGALAGASAGESAGKSAGESAGATTADAPGSASALTIEGDGALF